ncbi:hypothetical protein [Pseudomonas fontis]|uniref:Peptidase M4 domain-containing protein n=1 Tax=Pseudomonas fontis TaxID=2942633 RepID=A0ABT5P138_9PSED|nr:hypothetical protein [Pseudomonas fontis]MDD0977447.1 hypothetical protein [Pseudomonas fontis]MDD0994087.1 hypothetical protein [Pseudomonas fontis]
MAVKANTQTFTILAQDPAVQTADGTPLFAQVSVPLERLAPGPTGYRVKVVDFDASSNRLYTPHTYRQGPDEKAIDPFTPADAKLLRDPRFHCQHVYAIVMRTLARFELALGRRVAWGFGGHQLHIVPHAFVEANAFYTHEDRALLFGYFQADTRQVFTCLSHDIVAHETTHALLDGLRAGFMNASGPDQAAFHEGFADVVALLSVFSLREIIEFALTADRGIGITTRNGVRLINGTALEIDALANTLLFGLGEEFGEALSGLRANPLRRSVQLAPSKDYLNSPDYTEPHTRGELFAAAMLRSMLELWVVRRKALGTFGDNLYNLDAVIDEGAKAADQLLTIAIRALDYAPPLDLEFGDYLAALLTVDAEVAPDDSRFAYRQIIRATFDAYGIIPPPQRTDPDGCWLMFADNDRVQYRNTHFDSMLRDAEEVFRFLWENREVLNIDSRAYTEVVSVRPSLRVGPDGFLLRETVCEYISRANIFGSEVTAVCKMERPSWMKTTAALTVYGAGTLIFDQYGRIKYHIQRPLDDAQWQTRRLTYLLGPDPAHNFGATGDARHFAALHRARAMQPAAPTGGSQS